MSTARIVFDLNSHDHALVSNALTEYADELEHLAEQTRETDPGSYQADRWDEDAVRLRGLAQGMLDE